MDAFGCSKLVAVDHNWTIFIQKSRFSFCLTFEKKNFLTGKRGNEIIFCAVVSFESPLNAKINGDWVAMYTHS